MFLRPALRPNRIEEKKDQDYHVRYGRWCIGSYDFYQHSSFIEKYMVNTAFYKGNQWIFEQDLDSFFLDESGSVRNRIQVVHNIVKPFVEYYRGSLVRMDISAEAFPISRQTDKNREDRLNFLKGLAIVAQNDAQFREYVRAQGIPIESTIDETLALYQENSYDRNTEIVDLLIRYVSEIRNDKDYIKNVVGEDVIFSGLGVVQSYEMFGEQIWKPISVKNFMWDKAARRKDLKDAEYMGHFDIASAVEIMERHPNLSYDTRKAIEATAMTTQPFMHNMLALPGFDYSGRVPVYQMYWRDVDIDTYCAVRDEFDNPVLVKMDSPYYDKDKLISRNDLKLLAKENRWIEEKLKFNQKMKVPVDICRGIEFIPAEFNYSGGDIVLHYGELPYQTKYSYSREFIDWPYVCGTFAMIDGEVMSPLDALISPQRLLNRTLSIAESHLNNSRPSGMIIDRDSISTEDGEQEVHSNMNKGNPIFLNAQRQLNNAVGTYQGGITQGTITLFDIASRMKGIANDIVGSGEALTGGGGAYRVAVGAAQQNLTQGTIMQEPFFYCISNIIIQMFNNIANVGKRIYSGNGRGAYFALGGMYKELKITAEMELEEFRTKIRRIDSFYEDRDNADAMLMQFLQLGLIDQETFAGLLHRSTTAQVVSTLRKNTAAMILAKEKQAEEEKRMTDITNQQSILASQAADADMEAQMAMKGMEAANKSNEAIQKAAISADAQLEAAAMRNNKNKS